MHKIPEPFERKIRLDQEIQDIRDSETPDFLSFKAARDQQELARYSCIRFIKQQRGGGGSAGTG